MCREQVSCRTVRVARHRVHWALGWDGGRKGGAGTAAQTGLGMCWLRPGCPEAVVWDRGVSGGCSPSSVAVDWSWVSGEGRQCVGLVWT